MKKLSLHLLQTALAGICLLALAPGQAQTSDPARWYVDDATEQAQLRTLQKEIGAAYQEAQTECRRMPAAARSACMKDARATYQQDMANAKQQRAAAHPQ